MIWGCTPVPRFLALALSALVLTMAPAAAEVAPLPVEEVATGVFVHLGAHEEATEDNAGDIANIGFVVGTEAVAVIDPGGSVAIGQRLLKALRQRTALPVRYVVTTHMHPDHAMGAAAFVGEGASFVGHANLPRALASRIDTYTARAPWAGDPPPPVDMPVQGAAELDLGGRTLRLTAHPTAHTDNDLTVFDTATGTLWTGDLLFVERHPSLDGSLLGWLRALDALAQVPARRAIPGHGPVQGDWPGALEPLRGYLSQVVAEVRALQKAGVGIADAPARVAVDAKSRWLLFQTYHPQLVTAAYAELEWE